MEEYNYVFIELPNILLYKLKNNASIYETKNKRLVYYPSTLENLNKTLITINYLVILKREKRKNLLNNPEDLFVEVMNETICNNVIYTDWTCIWVEPLDSIVYEKYNNTIESYNLVYKIENEFFNSISLKSIYRSDYDWYHGYIDFPYHINYSIKKKVDNRKDKINNIVDKEVNNKEVDNKEVDNKEVDNKEVDNEDSDYYIPNWDDFIRI